jgi:universal stress protein A
MSDYTQILVAIDLGPDSQKICDKAINLAKFYDAKISIIHVLEPFSYTYGSDISIDFTDIQQNLLNQANEQLQQLAAAAGIASEDCHLMLGLPDTEIHKLAVTLDADLVVVGSHCRHGLALLFGSTANGIMRGSSCDVLAIRVVEDKKK